MVRTQVYLTEQEKAELDAISATRGVRQSELIREAIDNLIKKYSPEERLAALRQARGIWKNRKELPDVHKLRRGWSRRTAR
jgi:metal-responsive CopG/Arc/MetJ family transcriptional regulator